MRPLHITTFVFTSCVIISLIVPQMLTFPQIPINDKTGIMTPWTEGNHGKHKMFDQTTFADKACNIWKENPNISRILFYFFMQEECDSNRQVQDATWNIHLFVAAELVVFAILFSLAFNYAQHCEPRARSLIYVSAALWVTSFCFDVLGAYSYEDLNNFVYQQTYDISGIIYPSRFVSNATKGVHHVSFDDQESFADRACDMKRIFATDMNHWFIIINNCALKSMGDHKICSIAFKILAMCMLIVANVMQLCEARHRQYAVIKN